MKWDNPDCIHSVDEAIKYINEVGFGKDGERGFDGDITNLMIQTYLCNCDFKKESE